MSEFQENNLTQTHKTDPGDSVSMVEFKNRAYNYDRLEWGKGSDSKGLLAKKCISREHPDDQSAAECRTHKDIRRSLGKYIVKNRMAYMEETEKWTAYKTRISSGDYIKRDHFGCTDNVHDLYTGVDKTGRRKHKQALAGLFSSPPPPPPPPVPPREGYPEDKAQVATETIPQPPSPSSPPQESTSNTAPDSGDTEEPGRQTHTKSNNPLPGEIDTNNDPSNLPPAPPEQRRVQSDEVPYLESSRKKRPSHKSSSHKIMIVDKATGPELEYRKQSIKKSGKLTLSDNSGRAIIRKKK